MARDEVETAYFTLLRAREELDGLRRYEEYLRAEGQRLRRTASERQALIAGIERRMGRVVRATDKALEEAAQGRSRVIDDELGRLPDRIEAAEQYVASCEAAHLALKQGS
jgi:hypothetical protein